MNQGQATSSCCQFVHVYGFVNTRLKIESIAYSSMRAGKSFFELMSLGF